MRLAVTDACIFIDLYDLKILDLFFSLDLDLHTTIDVFNELYPEQQEALTQFELSGKLVIHKLSKNDRLAIQQRDYPKSLSMVDKTVLYLAVQISALLLSGDKAVRTYGKKLAIEYHGMLWIFDRIVEAEGMAPTAASAKLKELLTLNPYYLYSDELIKEVSIRIKLWES